MNSAADLPMNAGVRAASNSTVWLKRARQWHLWLGVLFAPSIIFFALSGALQLFGLHEGHPGEAYQPPKWIQKVGEIHKDQSLADRHGPPPGAGGERQRPARTDEGPKNERRGPGKATYALKWFFLATALGLTWTTLLGVYMAFKYNRSRTVVWGLLFLGTAIPLVIIAAMA